MSRRAILAVGTRARRYDLAFPRTQAIYVDDACGCAEHARGRSVVAALITAPSPMALLEIVLTIRKLAPTAALAVVDANFLPMEGALLRAGATICGDSIAAVLPTLSAAVVPVRRRGEAPAPIPRHRLH